MCGKQALKKYIFAVTPFISSLRSEILDHEPPVADP